MYFFYLSIYIYNLQIIYKNWVEVTNTTATTQQWRETVSHIQLYSYPNHDCCMCAGTAHASAVTTAASIEVLVVVKLEYRVVVVVVVVVVVTSVSSGSHHLAVGPTSATIVYTCGLDNIILHL